LPKADVDISQAQNDYDRNDALGATFYQTSVIDENNPELIVMQDLD